MGILGNELIYAVVVLLVAFASDTLLGEPPLRIHPVYLTGKMAEKLIRYLGYKVSISKEKTDKKGKDGKLEANFLKGVILIILCISAYIGIYFSIRYALRFAGRIIWEPIGEIFTFLIDVFFLKTTFSVKLMANYANLVFHELTKGNIEKAREITSHIVSRNTKELGQKHITSAVIESISENLVDGFFSPIFYFSFFSIVFGIIDLSIIGFESGFGITEVGITGAIIYRSVNTLDSMVGYHSFGKFGMPSAKLDDILTFIPARISPLIIIISAFILRMNAVDSLRITLSSKGRTSSPNSWIPMSAFSGALQVKLEKKKEYSIGDKFMLPSTGKIKEAVKLLYVSSLLGMTVVIAWIILSSIIFSHFHHL